MHETSLSGLENEWGKKQKEQKREGNGKCTGTRGEK